MSCRFVATRDRHEVIELVYAAPARSSADASSVAAMCVLLANNDRHRGRDRRILTLKYNRADPPMTSRPRPPTRLSAAREIGRALSTHDPPPRRVRTRREHDAQRTILVLAAGPDKAQATRRHPDQAQRPFFERERMVAGSLTIPVTTITRHDHYPHRSARSCCSGPKRLVVTVYVNLQRRGNVAGGIRHGDYCLTSSAPICRCAGRRGRFAIAIDTVISRC